jgi:hypothetical protein
MLFGLPRRIRTFGLFPFAASADGDVFGKADVFVREGPAFAGFLNRRDPEDIAVNAIADHEFYECQAFWRIAPEYLLQFVNGAQSGSKAKTARRFPHGPLRRAGW